MQTTTSKVILIQLDDTEAFDVQDVGGGGPFRVCQVRLQVVRPGVPFSLGAKVYGPHIMENGALHPLVYRERYVDLTELPDVIQDELSHQSKESF